MGFALQDGVLGPNPTVNREDLTPSVHLLPVAAPIDRRNLLPGCSTPVVNAAAAAAAAAEQDAQSIGAMPGVSQDSSEGAAASTQLAPRSRRPRATNVAVSKLRSGSPANTHEETQGQHTEELASSLLAEGVLTDRPPKKLKGPLNDQTVLLTPVAFKERTITEIYMQSSGSEKIGTLQNEEEEEEETPPAPKAKPRRKRHRAKVIREDKQGKKQDHPTGTTPEVKPPNQNGNKSYVRKTRCPSSLDSKCSGPVTVSDQSTTYAKVSKVGKRSIRVRTNSFVPIMDFSSGKSFSGGSIGLEGSDGKCQQTSPLAPNNTKTNHGIHCEAPEKNSENTSTETYMNLLQKVTSTLEYLNLNTELVHTNEMHRSVTTSAVVSSGAAGGLLNSLVPYERPLNLLKKQRPRAKVDLDFETTRVWELLMRKSTEPIDGADVDNERWWQKEREVFQGRANSFIKRMRLIQGDRHFSSWKGSVVDSVVGVFLTQNVSDHRSSSAYMALAASFPPGSVNNNCKDDITCQDNEEIISTSAVGGIRMFDFFDNSPIPDIGEHFEDLSITYEKIHVETKTNGTTGKKLPLVMPSDNHASQENCTNTVISTQNSPNMRTDLPAELHCDKSTRFEASDLQQHESLSATGEMIEETENRVNGFTSKSGLDEAAHASRPKKVRTKNEKNTENLDWDKFRRQACENGHMKEGIFVRRDSVDWEAVRCADVHIISHVIQERGMNNILAERIQKFLNRLVRDHGSIDLEWLRAIPPDSAKDYLLSIRGLGLKSVECVRLLTLHQIAFPVDTNVGRICVRLGWVPIQPLPESLQLHLIEQYPVLETIQKYLWPRLCKLDQRTLYELHCHMITFGKVFCTKTKPNCNACPMRSECRHFASAFASARLGLPAPEEKSLVYSSNQFNFQNGGLPTSNSAVLPQLEGWNFLANNSEPIIEEPESPREEERPETLESGIEDYDADSGEIATIKLNLEAFVQNLENCIKESNNEFRAVDIAKALVAIRTEAGSVPVPKLKNIHRLRTEHYVYEIPDSHSLVQQLGLGLREPGDPSPYLLTIWMQDDIEELSKAPKPCCDSQMEAGLCKNKNCQYCVHERENQYRYVRGTILVPCRTAMKGRFPLNGTYFQVNEVFADHKSSHDPVRVVREQLWDLPRRMVYFGTSVPAIFKGLTTEEVQQCFWRGFVCVRGFDMETRAPRPLCPHLHLAAGKLPRSRKPTATDEQSSDPARASVS